MRQATPAVLVVLALALAACPTREVSALNPIGEVETFLDVPVYVNRDVDILFVVDNSGSMEEEQGSFSVNMPRFMEVLDTAADGRPNLHIGVVSSNVGIGTYNNLAASCPIGGDRGRLQNTGKGCTPPAGYYISDIADPSNAGLRLTNYTGTLADTFTCIAKLGTTGCGFEQHLQSMRLALDKQNPVVENNGFLRDSAFLALIFLQDEDDCSARDTTVFDPAQDDLSAALGYFDSFRCAEFGVECCTEPGEGCTPRTLTRGAATYDGPCQPRRDSYLEHPDTYYRFLRELKGEDWTTPASEGLIIAAAITGQPTPFATQLNPTSSQPELVPSCTSLMGEAAPAVRMDYFLKLFDTRGAFESICQDNLDGAIEAVAALIGKQITQCLVGFVVTEDIDPEEPGLQLNCMITQATRTGQSDELQTVLAPCEMASDVEVDMSASSFPCWWAEVDAEDCPASDLTPTSLILNIERNGVTAPVGAHVVARCVATEPRCGDNHLDPGEDCDDGNNYDGDSCPATCQNP